MVKNKLTRNDFELVPDPVWIEQDGFLKPTTFFHDWWAAVAEKKFGDACRWADVAVELGYVSQDKADPIGFSYDPVLFRDSLGLPQNMPLVCAKQSDPGRIKRMWEFLLGQGGTDGKQNN
jgi:hypothetical protein